MGVCKIKGCNKKHEALGYCANHYMVFHFYPKHRKKILENRKKCRIYKLYKCKIKNCLFQTSKKYCYRHLRRIKYNLPMDLSIDCRHLLKGKNNINWKGGVAKYPNHYLMKKNRLIILLNNPKCEICGKIATQIHHRNGNKADHRLKNLMASCQSCNCKIRFKPNDSKYRRLYGMDLEEMSNKYKRSVFFYRYHHKKGDLKNIFAP